MIVTVSLANFIYSVSKDVVAKLQGRRRGLTPEQVLKSRQEWKAPFEQAVWKNFKEELRGPVVVRDVKRLDSYPHVDDKPRVISPWFRVGLIGTYHKGIQLGLGRGKLKKAEGGVEWRCTDHKSGENGDLAVVLVGRIPYERIEDVDWRGDEYYPFPHIYCHFDCTNGEPYETVAFCIERHHPDACPSYIEVAPYERVRRASKKAGIDPSF